MSDKIKKIIDWLSTICTICSAIIKYMTQIKLEDMTLFLYNHPRVIPLVILVFVAIAYLCMRISTRIYIAAVKVAYHLAGTNSKDCRIHPLLRGMIIIFSLCVLGIGVALVYPPIYYLEPGILQICIAVATVGFVIAGSIVILMCSLPNSFVQKHFKILFSGVVVNFVITCMSYSVLAIYQLM